MTQSKSSDADLAEGCVRLRSGQPWFAEELLRRRRVIDEIDPGIREVFRDLCEGRKPWPLFLHGLPGRGKGCAALCLIDYAGGWYIGVKRLCELLIDAQQGRLFTKEVPGIVAPQLRTERDVWNDWTRAPFAVLDELGRHEKPSPFHIEVVHDAIDKRIEEHETPRPTVFISNLNRTGIGAVYGGRIYSRLGSGTVAELTGPDRRIENVEDAS